MTRILEYIARCLRSVEQWCRYRAEDIEFSLRSSDD
jgi:hypothetical protein